MPKKVNLESDNKEYSNINLQSIEKTNIKIILFNIIVLTYISNNICDSVVIIVMWKYLINYHHNHIFF